MDAMFSTLHENNSIYLLSLLKSLNYGFELLNNTLSVKLTSNALQENNCICTICNLIKAGLPIKQGIFDVLEVCIQQKVHYELHLSS